MKNRIKKIRKELNLTQQAFSEKLGITRNNIAGYEAGNRNPSDAVISLICTKFDINEEWLRNGTGEMFRLLPEEDETAAIVSDLLEEESPLYDIIKGIMKTYSRLDSKSQETLDKFSRDLLKNLHTQKED